MMPRLINFACKQPPIMKERAQLVPKASGDVLELGCGGGANLNYYDRNAVRSLSGLDPSPELLDYTRDALQKNGLEMDIKGGFGEDMPFKDDSFDTVLCTFTLCTVTDNKQVLSEMRRVLKPEGKILYLEHGRSPDKGPQKWQKRIEPVWKRLAGGCHLTRPVSETISGEGFGLHENGGQYMEKSPRWLGWTEWGEARPL